MRFENIYRSLSLLVAGLAAISAGAATVNLTPGMNLTVAVEHAGAGDLILLANGTYTANAGGAPPNAPGVTSSPFFPTTFAINKQVTIRGNTANPALVVLQSNAADYAVRFLSYNDGFPVSAREFPNGATLEGVTISGGGAPHGILVDDYANTQPSPTRLTDITIRNVVISAPAGFGVVAGGVSNTGPQRLTLDAVTVTSGLDAMLVRNTLDSLVINSRVTGTTNGTALFLNGGQRNVVVNNVFGNAPALNGTTMPGTGVTILNAQATRFELNTVQGHATDGVVFFNSNIGDTSLQALDNYAGKNSVLSNGFAATLAGVPGRTNGTGIWVNCGANNSWLFGNDVQGGPEAALTIWSSKNNMLLGNLAHNNEDAGIFVSGGSDVYAECLAVAYRIKSTNNTLQSNSVYYNKIDSIIVRDSDFTDLILNHVSPTNGLGGASQPCVVAECQSGFSFEGPQLSVTGSRVLRNTSRTNRGLWVNFGNIVNLEFFGNRVLGSTFNRLIAPSTFQNLDWGGTLGGNHWSQHAVAGNPGTTPFTGISYDNSNNINGPVSDRFPYQSESFGISQMSVSEPVTGDYAIGSARTVRWNAPGCAYVDIALDGTTALQTSFPNTGYAVVTIPNVSLATHNIAVKCKNSAGTLTGASANSQTFTVKSNQLILLAPGRDDVFNAGQTIAIAWSRAAGFAGAVNIELTTDGTNYTTPAGWSATYTGNFAYLTLPAGAGTAYAKVRISSGTARDTNDNVFAIHGTGQGFRNVAPGRSFTMGRVERLEWSSPANSRLVNITYNTGSGAKTVVTGLPDRGSYDWVVPDIGTSSNLVLTVNFLTNVGGAITSAASSTAATVYAGVGGPFTLSVSAIGSGTVTSSPAGISCPPTCEAVFPINQVVNLSAVAGGGSTFFGYSGACVGATCSVTMSTDRAVTGAFYTGTLVTRYRLYSSGTLEHLYTTDLNEYNVLPACCAWQPEGAIYRVHQGPGTYGGVSAVPYYRLYNSTSHQHHWTTDAFENSFLPSVGWTQEGIDGYILPSAVAGSLPLYRLYINAAGGLHLWTTDLNERNFLTTNAGWTDEGIAGYVLPLP